MHHTAVLPSAANLLPARLIARLTAALLPAANLFRAHHTAASPLLVHLTAVDLLPVLHTALLPAASPLLVHHTAADLHRAAPRAASLYEAVLL